MSVNDEIKALVEKSNDQRSLYKSYKSKYETAVTQKKQYKQRLEELEDVQSNLKRSFDDVVGDIKSNQKSAKKQVDAAVDGLSAADAIVSALEGDYEQATESDKYGSQMHAKISAEIDLCEEKIASAKSDVKSYAQQANACVDLIKSYHKQIKALLKDPECTITVTLGDTPSKLSTIA